MPGCLNRRNSLSLKDLTISGAYRLLVLAPHPDDFDVIGVTLRHFKKNGNPMDVAIATSGASGVEDAFCTPPLAETKMAIREDEQRASCRFFGLRQSQLSFLRLDEDDKGHPLESRNNVDTVFRHFQAKRPDLVFLPHGNDTNVGHQRTYSMFASVAKTVGYPLVAFLNRDPKTIRMRHDVYLCFGKDEAEWKAQLLRFHRSQHQRNLNHRGYGLDERILMVDRQNAETCPVDAPYAEVFELAFFGEGQVTEIFGPLCH